mgnify:CR=1 FL=1
MLFLYLYELKLFFLLRTVDVAACQLSYAVKTPWNSGAVRTLRRHQVLPGRTAAATIAPTQRRAERRARNGGVSAFQLEAENLAAESDNSAGGLG